MAWDRLRRIVAPPDTPTFVPTASDWLRVQSELGVDFPEEHRQFCDLYGMGTFRGSETTALSVWCPGYPQFVEDFRFECQRLRDIRGPVRNEDHPFDVFPNEGGILPLALDECDVWLCWVTHSRPADWPILVRWSWGTDGMSVFDMPLSTLLVALFERRIDLPCFPPPTFTDNVRFIPYESGRPVPVPVDPRWLTSDVVDLARAIDEDRAYDQLPMLADALTDAGCDSEAILGHCRVNGPHFNACWVVNLVLGKE
jgi:hypothetical protein